MKVMILIPPSKFSKNVARDLIYGCWCKGKRIAGVQFPPISQLTVATFLRHAGNDVILYDAAAMGKSMQELQEEIAKGYQIVIMLTSTMTINEDTEIFSLLKQKNPRLVVIVYGAHPTFMPIQTLSRESIDIAVQREPEFILRDVIAGIQRNDESWKTVRGIAFRHEGGVKVNEPYPFIENLDEIPIPDRTLLASDVMYFNPVVKRMPFTTMFTSRGCPGRCIYCSSPPFYGKVFRSQTPERVIKEMEEIQRLGYKEIFFRDEVFPITKKRTMEICRKMIEKKFDFTWICSARVGSLDLEMMQVMKEAGCHMIRFGVESGAQEVLDKINKGITLEETRKTFALTHKVNMDTHAHLMIGMPGDTKETIRKTLKFVQEISPTTVTFGICTPYPGTQLFQQVTKTYPKVGDGSSCDLSVLHTNSFYNEMFTDLTTAELAKSIRTLYRSFYLRPAYVFGWLKRIKSFAEFKRVILAGMQVFDFVARGD